MASVPNPFPKGDFYRFFCHWSTNRSSAVASIVAGSVAGGLLTLMFLIGGFAYALRSDWTRPESQLQFTLGLVTGLITIGTWKRVLSAPLIGVVIAIGVEYWLIERRDIAIAVFAFFPFVCGFVTAARGVYVLNRPCMERHDR
jgi:hypothetical protein